MEPWFDANSWAWAPGTILGTTFGIWGSLAGSFGPQGRFKPLVMGLLYLLLGFSLILVVAGVVALAMGQPWVIILVLAPVGLFGLVLGIPLGMVANMVYRMAEERAMQARDLIAKDG